DRGHGGVVGEAVAGFGHHHRVDDQRLEGVALDRPGDGLGGLGRADHAGLGGLAIDVAGDGVDLRFDEVGGEVFDAIDAARVLGGDGGDDRTAKDLHGGPGLEVGLDSGPAGGIAAGD